jgi:hypothetical protein
MAKTRRRNHAKRQQRSQEPGAPTTKAQPDGGRKRDPQHRRLLNWIVTANKAVLAAVGAGILGIVTGAIIGLPHLLSTKVFGSPPLAVAGNPSPDIVSSADPCSLQGSFIVPGTLHQAGTVSTGQLAALLKNAVDFDSTDGTYTLQASPGQTVVITAIHTIVLRRIPAPRATEVQVNSMCAGAAPVIYSLSINLDATNLTPKIQIEDPGEAGKMTTVHGLQTIVTNDDPIIIDFAATTHRYDVTWRLLIDYTVNGQSRTALIQNGSQPFHTIAGRDGDTALTFMFNFNQSSWTIQNGLQNS